MAENNSRKPLIDEIDVVVLCGGKGTRLQRVVSDRPKPMAEINGKPFLEIVMDYLFSQGSRRFILCTGYKSEVINDYFKGRFQDREAIISREEAPLGTGGAVLNALEVIESDHFFLLNGDSFALIDLIKMAGYHVSTGALATVALVQKNDADRYGAVHLEKNGEIIEFSEKTVVKGSGWINAGIYLLNKEVFSVMDSAQAVFSMEYDVFPKLIGKGLYGFELTDASFIDIGTPQSYANAKKMLDMI